MCQISTVRVGGQSLHLADLWVWREEPAKSYWELGKSVSQLEGAKSEGLHTFGKVVRNAKGLETGQEDTGNPDYIKFLSQVNTTCTWSVELIKLPGTTASFHSLITLSAYAQPSKGQGRPHR